MQRFLRFRLMSLGGSNQWWLVTSATQLGNLRPSSAFEFLDRAFIDRFYPGSQGFNLNATPFNGINLQSITVE